MLEVNNLRVRYGRHIALDGVSAKVEKGEICVILGANGAGKSSLLKAIAGMVKAEPGTEISMNGKPITGMKPHRIVEEGIALVPEGRGIFGDLTVAENLQLGAFAARARHDEAAMLALIYELFPRLAERKRQIARTMSGGEQQMVAIGRALMSKPDILMLDEPSLGLSPLLSKELFKSLSAVAATGVGILLVEQNARLSLKIARRGYLIENGLITGEDEAAALMNDPAVVNAYLGGGGGAGTTKDSPATKKSGIRLPAAFALPMALEAMSKLMDRLADRAGRIQSAFIKALRRDNALPSAFAGLYDPALGSDPWDEIDQSGTAGLAPARKSGPSEDARAIADTAADMAARASRRLAEHLHMTRLSGTVPAAFQGPGRSQVDHASVSTPAMPRVAEWPHSTDAEIDIVALARRADERLRQHIFAGRVRAPAQPVQSQPEQPSVAPQAAAPVEAVPSPGEPSIQDMAARAEQRMRTHLAAQRGPTVVSAPRSEPVAVAEPRQVPPPVATEAESSIEDMAARAEQRMRAHLASRRVAPTTPAPVPQPASAPPHVERRPEPQAADDIEDLARAAGDRLRDHLQFNRDATLTARVRLYDHAQEAEPEEDDAEEAPRLNGSSSLVGHNSRGAELDDDGEAEERPADVDAGDIAGLAARASAIQAAHLQARRKKLTIFTISPDDGVKAEKSDDKKHGSKKHKRKKH